MKSGPNEAVAGILRTATAACHVHVAREYPMLQLHLHMHAVRSAHDGL
jgi:hypothetical protein